MKKKRGRKHRPADLPDISNPVITINESDGEGLFAIVDFTIPGNDQVRRLIAKRFGNGNISAATYVGKVVPDRTCTEKHFMPSAA